MSRRLFLASLALLGLAACSSSAPRVIQASSSAPDMRITVGMATQVEMPNDGHVQSVTVGDPTLLSAEQAGDVVNLVAKAKGETNMIIRSREDGDTKVYQYRITIQGR